jgi:hypothetical protein
MSSRTATDTPFITKSITNSAFALSLPLRPLPDDHVSFRRSASSYARLVTTTAILVRWSDAAGILGVDARRVLDLIAAGELEPVRRPDDL